ncbi:hypothetical protein [Metaplanococcus flavidus]|uniref:hypothetical protein n=1 Tax=Metaplanococcus flavidus TaxID=569883 RepID=UPI0011967D17
MNRYLFIFTLIMTLFLVGCGINETTVAGEDEEAQKAAWDYIVERDWNKNVQAGEQDVEVREVKVDSNYELLDESYIGERVLSISFEGDGKLVTEIPTIIVDSDTNEVVGYIPSE